MAQDGLEAALAAAAERIDTATRASALTTRELKRASAAAATGSVRDLRRALDAAVAAAQELEQSARAAQDAYDFEETQHLASGACAAAR